MVTSFLFCSLTKSMCLCVCLNRRFSILPLWLSLLVYNAVKQFVLYLIYIYVFVHICKNLLRTSMPSVSCSRVSCFSVCPRDTYEVRPTFCDKPGELVGCLYDFEDTGLFMTDGLPYFLSFGCLTQNLGTDKKKTNKLYIVQ